VLDTAIKFDGKKLMTSADRVVSVDVAKLLVQFLKALWLGS